MKGKVAKKIRKLSKRNWIEYIKAVEQWPWRARARFAWWLIKPRWWRAVKSKWSKMKGGKSNGRF